MSPRFQRAARWVLIGAVTLIALIILDMAFAFVLLLLEERWVTSSDGRGQLHYWFQIVSGNWSEQKVYTIPSFAFSLTVSTAIMLNYGPVVAIFGLFAGVLRRVATLQQEYTMKLGQALAAKDEVTKQALYSVFGDDQDTIDRINGIFEDSEKAWRPHLISIVGRKAAGVIMGMLDKNIPTPK